MSVEWEIWYWRSLKLKLFKIFLSILFVLLLFLGSYEIYFYSEKISPESVQISIADPEIREKVRSHVSHLIRVSNEEKGSRSEFLKDVGHFLNEIDFINQFWVRLGLDKKLQIDATMQIPTMILEAKYGERYLVSSSMNILSKNPSTEKFPGLFALSIPEMKVYWKSKEYSFKENNKNVYYIGEKPINFLWLTKQADIIHSQTQVLGSEYFFNKLSWTLENGFVLTMLRKPSDMTFVVFIGHNDIAKKIQNLKILLSSLSSKNLYPQEIDLNYLDKANFKL